MSSYSRLLEDSPHSPSDATAPPPNVGFAPSYPQGQPQGYPDSQPLRYPYPQGQPQGYPPDQPQGSPYPPSGATVGFEVLAPGYPQDQALCYPQGQPQGYPQGQPQGNPPDQPQGQSQGYPQSQGDGPGLELESFAPALENAPDHASVQLGGCDGSGLESFAPALENAPDYASVQLDGSAPPPPTQDEATRESLEREAAPSAAFITAEEAREALAKFASPSGYYEPAIPIEEIKFTDLRSSNAFHYRLESFCEKRSVQLTYESYREQTIMCTGPPPEPMEMQVEPSKMFRDETRKVEVPNTSKVKICHKCNSRGNKECLHCNGRGNKPCLRCKGRGEERDTLNDGWMSCTSCDGRGVNECQDCRGRGHTKCTTCDGHCSLKWYHELTIEWKNHVDDHVETTSLPSELVPDAAGQKAFEEKFPRRHSINIVPVTEVMYERNEENGSFFVYGLQHQVHFPGFLFCTVFPKHTPQDCDEECCCCCNII